MRTSEGSWNFKVWFFATFMSDHCILVLSLAWVLRIIHWLHQGIRYSMAMISKTWLLLPTWGIGESLLTLLARMLRAQVFFSRKHTPASPLCERDFLPFQPLPLPLNFLVLFLKAMEL